MSKEALIIFAKNPELGEVKTRLAKAVGDEAALDIYYQLLAYTQEQTAKAQIDLIVYYTTHIDEKDNWINTQKKLQCDGDLGNKMAQAISSELEKYEKVCIIGTDCAQLKSFHIQGAFQKLEEHDIVIGPANDGGYYLLGMKSFEPSLFEGIDWSTDKVFSQTIKAISLLNRNYAQLPELIDVDTIEDWNKVQENFK
ncbi:MAG: TIGR04282 family arsenosugar biosynthesis glycosyltransferase [Reichenbachiella sp.]|uniref:TIGR04282 family arsenosugar biosynthesis glycosyltransferase n=1 Tax=Reichenbachiella sp. TaxID=2184521 RepID=UPI003298E710